MSEKPNPKFRPDDIVSDRELKVAFVIKRFSHHQLNGSPWYHAERYDTREFTWLCEDWLVLIERPKKPSRRVT